MARWDRREPIFLVKDDHELFLKTLAESRGKKERLAKMSFGGIAPDPHNGGAGLDHRAASYGYTQRCECGLPQDEGAIARKSTT
jgi:hypothetical protein